MPRRFHPPRPRLALAVALTAGACSSEPTELPRSYPIDQIAWGSVADDVSATEILSGQYRLISQLDVQAGTLFPDLEGKTLRALTALAQDAAKTMFQLADDPLVDAVVEAVPPAMRIDEEINAWVAGRIYQSVPVPDYLSTLVDRISGMFADFHLVTAATIATPDETGDTYARHDLAAIQFAYADASVLIHAPKLIGSPSVGVAANAVHVDEQSPAVEDARVYFADHTMIVPIGKLAMLGVNQAIRQFDHVADLRSALGLAVDCSGLGASVASACAGSDCGELAPAVIQLCASALDRVVNEVEQQLADISIGTVRFTGGEAALYDAPQDGARDGKIDRIERGHWDVTIGRAFGGPQVAGAIMEEITGTFVGTRVGDYLPPSYPGSDRVIGADDARFVDGIGPHGSSGGIIFRAPQIAVTAPVEPPVLGGGDLVQVPVGGASGGPGGDSAIDPSHVTPPNAPGGERVVETRPHRRN
jgi:hypothetical protein